MRLRSVSYLINEGVENVWRNKIMAFASFCVLLISILLVGFAYLFTININGIIGDIESRNELAIYFSDTALNADYTLAEQFLTLQMQEGNVKEFTYYPKEQAFEDMKQQLAANGENDVDLLFAQIENDNPLPNAYRVKVKDVALLDETVASLSTLPGISKINSPSTFANVLTQLKKITTYITIGVIAALLLVSFVIIYNSTRVSVYARRKEISIMKYVGATNSFIRLPFFIEGLIIGIFAGFCAAAITWFTYDYIIETITSGKELTMIIQNGLTPFENIAYPIAIVYVLAGGIIGSLGTVISMRKHLDV